MASTSATGATSEASATDADARNWIGEIEQAEKDMAAFWRRAKKIRKIYAREESKTNAERQFAMLWANVEVLKPVVYSRQPKPVVSRRFNDQDPVGRQVSELLQRSLVSIFERSEVDVCLRGVRDDFLLVGRGTAWIRYAPKFEPQTIGEETIDALTDETLGFDFVHWSDFLHPKNQRWELLPWVGRRVYLDKASFLRRFAGQGAVDKDDQPVDGEKLWAAVSSGEARSGSWGSTRADRDAPKGMVAIYEIWSRRDDQVVWVAKTYPEFLDRQPPLYRLHGFFPCPRPAYGTLPTDSLIPTPDYVYYQDQAEEIDELTARIGALQDSLKLVGFYPAGAEGEISSAIEKALNPLTKEMMIPVPAWAVFVQGGGAKQMIEWLPVDMVLEVLKGCVELRKQLVEDVYQITGISDILRGDTDPNETKGAQQIKAQWGSIRIRDRQAEMARFARDLARISAEIIAEKFQPETLWRMTGLKFPSAAEKQQANALVQQQAQQAQMAAQQASAGSGMAPAGMPGAGAPAPPPAPGVPQPMGMAA